MKQTYGDTRRLIRADIAWRCQFENKTVSRLTTLRLMFHPGVATVLLLRWQRFFDDHGLQVFGSVCRWLNLVMFTSSYSSTAQIAGGFLVVHAVANYVDDGVVIGPRCVFFSQNSLARSPFVEAVPPPSLGVPVVDSDVVFGMGACVQGNVRIAALCNIGMNTLVDFNTAPNTNLLGVPARVSAQKSAAAE
jgi:serine acetyltransferase